MNKKVCAILLAAAVNQSSIDANWKEWKSKGDTPSTRTQKDVFIAINDSLSQDAAYIKKLTEELRDILEQAKKGAVNTQSLESVIITQHAPALIKPGNDALVELEEKSEQEIAELRSKNEELANHITTTRRALLLSLAVAGSYIALSYAK